MSRGRFSKNVTLAASDIGAVPASRTVNGKALSADVSLTAGDLGAVPVARKVNNKALSSDISLSAADVGAVPTTRTVNGLQLSSDIHLTPPDLGAASGVQLLDNAYWAIIDAIINQRGLTEYNGFGYTIDRWVLSRGSIELTPNGLKILKSTDQSSVVLFQYIENSIPMEIPVVLSALVDKKLIAMRRTAIDETIYFGAMALRIESHINPMCLNIYAIDDEPHIISAMKFELGTQQTLAHQDAAGNWVLNDPPPDKALELAKCQRYYIPSSASYMIAQKGPGANLAVYMPCVMRAIPTSLKDTAEIFQTEDNSWRTVKVSGVERLPTQIKLYFNDPDGITLPYGTIYLMRNYPALSADL